MSQPHTSPAGEPSPQPRPQGWYLPLFTNTTKRHYHDGKGKSLCRKYGITGSGTANFSSITPLEKDRCKMCFDRLQTKSN